MPVKVKVKSSGRVRGPNLSDPQLKIIGDAMVKAQKERWAKAVNADGQPAKKLSVKYFFEKRKLRGGRPVRDMIMTGALAANFQLRKAADGTIRAENTTKVNRDKAKRCQQYDQMIGFSGSDSSVVFNESLKQYGNYLIKAWMPIRS